MIDRIVSPQFLLGALAVALVVTSTQAAGTRTSFTQKEISKIKELVRPLDSRAYRIVLPVVKNNKVVGSEVLGKLPITRVRRVASAKGIANYSPSGNLQAIFQNGGGAGSHTESGTPAKGNDVAKRIESILQDLDKSSYIFLR